MFYSVLEYIFLRARDSFNGAAVMIQAKNGAANKFKDINPKNTCCFKHALTKLPVADIINKVYSMKNKFSTRN